MIEATILEMLLANGVLGAVCAFFMLKDYKMNSNIIKTLDKISIILDERIPKRKV